MSIIIRFDNPIQTESHLKEAISYIMKEKKAKGRTYSNSGITPEQILDTFLLTKEMNPSHGNREGYHLKLSFSKEETISHDAALEFVKEWAEGYLGKDYDYVVAEHSDRELTHMHLIFNSVKRNGGKYHYDNREWEKVITPLTNQLCEKYGTGLLKEKDKKLDYTTTKDWKKKIENDIEECILRSKSYEDFKNRMQKEYHYILREGISRDHGVYLALTPPGKARAVRSYQLKPGHMPADIDRAIQKRIHGSVQEEPSARRMAMEKETAAMLYRAGRKWDPVRCRRISYQQMSVYQKYFARRAYQARRLYGRTNTTLKFHEQSVRAVNRMMKELALICRYDIRSERELSESIEKLEKQEECREDRKDLKKILGGQKEIRQERKVVGHDQRTKQ